MLEYQAKHAEETGPAMEIFIGSKNNENDWLPPNPENIGLLQSAPPFLFREIKGRHAYFEFQSRHDDDFLRILPNGFIISKFPSIQWDKEKEQFTFMN